MCGNDQDKLHIHHNTYDHRGYEEYYPEDLVCLCEKCHNKYHSYDKLVEENEKLKDYNSYLTFENEWQKREWEQDERTANLLEIIEELKEERDYIQRKFDLWRKNRKKDIEYMINVDNNDDELPF